MDRKCGVCDARIVPFEAPRLVGIPVVHRYRCSCGSKFDVLTSFGRAFLVAITVLIVGLVALLPASKFASPSDRTEILVVLVGLQVPVVAWLVWRSAKNDRRHAPWAA